MNKYEVLGILLEAYSDIELVYEDNLLKQFKLNNFLEEDLNFVLEQLNRIDEHLKVRCDIYNNDYVFIITGIC